MRNSQALPPADVVVGVRSEVACIFRMAGQLSDNRHGLNSNDALKRKIRLVSGALSVQHLHQ
jgi:hypothetical protein